MLYDDALADQRVDKFIINNFLGISNAVAREMSFRACGDIDATLRNCSFERIYSSFNEIIEQIKNCEFTPTTVFDGERAVEYAFCRLSFY